MIGHRLDGSRMELRGVEEHHDVFEIYDWPEKTRFDRGVDYSGMSITRVSLRRVRLYYPSDDWQGPLESDWYHLDDEWRLARALYLEELSHSCRGRDDVERLLNLRFPDDREIARIVAVMCVVHLIRLCLGHELPRVRQRLTPWPGARPPGRVEVCFVERGAPRFSGWDL